VQFIKNGPDVPESLLQAHEDGNVVFFCGAGISMPAGLPTFGELVNQLYEKVGVLPDPVQKAAIKAGQFDTAITLLETDVMGGRESVRKELVEILTPDLTTPKSISTHDALLTLSKTRKGKTHLITTNYDRVFEERIDKNKLSVQCFNAPFLPVPKKRWDGLVYLHGLLQENPTANELDHLVLSSGDFGLAYLTERWAARFVSELFRGYIVCFIGYSLNDPVLRYMMDALAADRLLGESPPEVFAFGSYSNGKLKDQENQWRAKNVTPILYRAYKKHYYLHQTLHKWSETYRDGLSGKEQIVVSNALARPIASTQQDDFVGRMLWALNDESGLPAKQFANFDPVPSLDWLESLSEYRYQYDDLVRFGIRPNMPKDRKLKFCFLHRPTSYEYAPWMSLVNSVSTNSDWDDVMEQLARWLIRHLDDPDLVLWIANKGGQLHERFIYLIEDRLELIERLVAEKNHDELQRIKTAAKNAIPGPLMKTIWRLVLGGRLSSGASKRDLYLWIRKFKQNGLSLSLRIELRELLSPRISLRKPFSMGEEKPKDPVRLKDLFSLDIELTADMVHSTMPDLANNADWIKVLPELLGDFTLLLKDTFDLMYEIGEIDEKNDFSYIHQSSISKHPQNKDYNDWTVLIELCRDAWLAAAENSPEQARLCAEDWMRKPYPVFKRLALFCATHEKLISASQALGWLLEDKCWWLWSVGVEREVLRLIVSLVPRLNVAEMKILESSILQGPPRDMFREDIDQETFNQIIEREQWLRLAKINAAGVLVGDEAKKLLNEISNRNLEWLLSDDEREEFPTWHSTDGDWRKFVASPQNHQELIEWLKQPISADHWQEDDWLQRCRDDFKPTSDALIALSKEGFWPDKYWREAILAWTDEKHLEQSWREVAGVIVDAPDELVQVVIHSLGNWLQALAKTFEGKEVVFFKLINRVLKLADEIGNKIKDDPVSGAINHPVGHVTEGLLRYWYRNELEDGQGLQGEIKSICTELCNTNINKYRHGRVILSAHVIALFRVDESWASKSLLPLYDWRKSEIEAASAWEGFLWSPRLYRPLFKILKSSFLDTAKHYEQIKSHSAQYASLLVFVALDSNEIFKPIELAEAVEVLPEEGLRNVAQGLTNAVTGAGEQREEYWCNRVKPFLLKVWPKSRERATPMIAQHLCLLCIATQDAFSEAFEKLQYWLQPIEYPEHIVRKLEKSGLSRTYPADALGLLDRIISNNIRRPPGKLKDCLDGIRESWPELETDERYKRLSVLLKKHGMWGVS